MKKLFLLTSALCSFALTVSAQKPDVVVILTDQWSPRYTSWDNPQVKTPHLDQIAKEGMIFDACYTTSPVCMPARVSLITGLYPHNHGHALWGNASGYYVRAETAPMFRDMQQAGYTTAQIGKLHWNSGPEWKREYPTPAEYHKALGLDVVKDIAGPPDNITDRGLYGKYLSGLGLLDGVAKDIRRRYVLWEFEPRASLASVEQYHDSFTTGQAVDFIKAQPKDKPLCLVVSLHSPHPPLDAPGEYATMYDPEKLTLPANVPESFKRESFNVDHATMKKLLANYLGKISLVDHCTGRLVTALKERGTWDNTLVAFTADHGEMMGAHGMLTKGRFYEESARVPLVVRWPAQVKPGRSKAPVQMMDVYPTLVEAAGGKTTPGRFARSLMPIATGKRERIRPVAISEIGDTPPLRIMVRDVRYKYWADESREYLYDLDADPLEMTDLSADPAHQGTMNRMREQLLLQLRSSQVNFAEGYKSKVKRVREEEASRQSPK
ncbi:arylsulfatase A-like enzyme [Roseimicrobium gellanilyticum]|uniref:Arylsulfatase A-like enzyme n=1 Tax=Roseimicrobium gellanilyticum TaxID=748857 RepID=A0A366HA01_9BACT|nr:sulfatase-like hydrolase/transferase [Roseimicrobium gellanilyticum]RBP38657.1 arylsulfatase A-like enzyme [Roseimicrobium gellanilyticum]